ncbi:hypothetical protein IFM89_031258 [Coptis chinensis]|uniref:PPM-type phosphatase domain-containing protein n=1 Tax=Coptis chinensis TaxID=261450 RepID=A0A835IXX5_9MAGN|nr:hypothetical protein IFM89_031258 [Coptis chinensis]
MRLLTCLYLAFVLNGDSVKKHTKKGKGAPHRTVMRMVGAARGLQWGKSSKRNVICMDTELGPSSAFERNRRRKGGVEVAELWVRGINLAFYETEEGFISDVKRELKTTPLFAAIGTCCLVGIIWKGALYFANLGYSQAVIGRSTSKSETKAVATQLTVDHNVKDLDFRNKFVAEHGDEAGLVAEREDRTWCVKGIIQITRSIGDVYLKRPGFLDRLGETKPRFHPESPIDKGFILSLYH